MTNAVLWGKPKTGNPHARFDEWEVASAKPRRWFLLDKKIKNMLVSLALLGTVMASSQGKSETFDYESAGTLGEIRDMSLSSENKMFALKTSGAKIDDMELPVWVGNTDNLRGAFSAPWMTNAVASCAFFRDRLYIAPKGETNFLYRVDVGTNQMPHVKSASEFSTGRKMTEPYLYATTNCLYAFQDRSQGGNSIIVSKFLPNENALEHGGDMILSSVKKENIKDIVSKTVGTKDFLYVLTTSENGTGGLTRPIALNGNDLARLWLVNSDALGEMSVGEITPQEWKKYDREWDFYPFFDQTTTIAIHGNDLLTANANYDRGCELGYKFPINEDGTLGNARAFIQSDEARVSAIGSDSLGNTGTNYSYYAESITSRPERYHFLKRNNGPKVIVEPTWDDLIYNDNSRVRQGEPVHKFTTQKSGEIFGVSKDCIYRIKSGNGRGSKGQSLMASPKLKKDVNLEGETSPRVQSK